MPRLIIFTVVLIAGLIFLYKFLNKHIDSGQKEALEYEIPYSLNIEDRYYLPGQSSGQIVHHEYFSLSYVEKYEQAEWVAYELTKASLMVKNVPRTNKFLRDNEIRTGSATHRDYSNSGYTRGHIAPAGDMAFNERAMRQSFFMSNVSPQKREFNNGIWRDLEEQTRKWAKKEDRLYIVAGPVLEGINEWIGENRVGVPKYFFKVILDLTGKQKKGLGFIIPHEESENSLQSYITTIDSVEMLTGLDFFYGLMSEELENNLESGIDLGKWHFSNSR